MTDDEKVVQILSKVIVNTVKNMMGDYDQTVAQKLKNIKISADNILPMSIDSTKIQKGSIQMADIANLEAKIAEIVQLDVDNVKINYAQIRDLDVYMADIAYAKIDWLEAAKLQVKVAEAQYAKVGQLFADQASIKKLDANIIWGATNITTKGIADKFYINELAVTDASIVDLTVDKLKVRGADDPETHEPVYYKLTASEAGVVTEAVKLNGAYLKTNTADGSVIKDLTLNGDDKIVGGSITARTLNASDIFANNATIKNLIAANIDVDTLFARQATFGKITTDHLASDVGSSLDLSSNTSIKLRTAKGLENSNYLLGTRTGSSVEIGSSGSAYTTRYLASDSGNAVLTGNTKDDFTLSFEYTVGGNEGDAVTVTPYFIKPPTGAMRYTITSGVQELNCGSSGTYSCTFKLTNAQSLLGEYAFYFGIAGTEGVEFSLSKLKLEKGTSRTAYNYALEEGSDVLDTQLQILDGEIRADVTEQIADNIESTKEALETTISQTSDSIRADVSAEIETMVGDATSATKQEFQTELALMNDSIAAKVSQTDYDNDQEEINDQFTEMQLSVDGVRTEVSDLEEKQAKWFNMGTDGLEIGERTYNEQTDTWEAGDFTALLSNTKLAFKQKDEEVAYISNLALMITQAAIKNTLSLGGLSGVLDGYAINWVFDDDAPLVRRNYFSGTATPNSITMASGANYQYGSWISIVTAGQSLISGNQDDVFTVSYDYSLTNVPSDAPSFRIGMLFDSGEVDGSVWPIRVSGGNNYSIIVADRSSEYSGKFETTFKLNAAQASGTITRMRGYIRSDDGSTGWTPTLTISHLKLEKNNTPTTWVEALED